MNRMRSARWPLPALVGLTVLAACSDSTPTATTPPVTTATTTTTTQPAATVIMEGTAPLQARTVYYTDVTTPSAGRITVTVDYGSASNQILLWLTDRRCSYAMFDRDDCDYLVKSLEGPKPRVMTSPTVAAGTYTLFVANDGPGDDQVTYRVTLAP